MSNENGFKWMYEPSVVPTRDNETSPTTVIHPLSPLPYDACLQAAYKRYRPQMTTNTTTPPTTPAALLDEVDSCKSHVWRYAYHPMHHSISYLGANVKPSSLRGSLSRAVGDNATPPIQTGSSRPRLTFADLSENGHSGQRRRSPPPLLFVPLPDGPVVTSEITTSSAPPLTSEESGGSKDDVATDTDMVPRRMLFPMEKRSLKGSVASPSLLHPHFGNEPFITSDTIDYLLDRVLLRRQKQQSGERSSPNKSQGIKANPLEAKRVEVRRAGWGLIDMLQSRYQDPSHIPTWASSSSPSDGGEDTVKGSVDNAGNRCRSSTANTHLSESRWADKRRYTWLSPGDVAVGGSGGSGMPSVIASGASWGPSTGMGVHISLPTTSQRPVVAIDVGSSDIKNYNDQPLLYTDESNASSALHHTGIPTESPPGQQTSSHVVVGRTGVFNSLFEQLARFAITNPLDGKAYPLRLFGYIEPTAMGSGRCWFQQVRFAVFRLHGDNEAFDPAMLVKVIGTTPKTMISRPSMLTPTEMDRGHKTILAPKLWMAQGSVFPAASQGGIRISWFPKAAGVPDTLGTTAGPAHPRHIGCEGIQEGFDRVLQSTLLKVLHGGWAGMRATAEEGFYTLTCSTSKNAARGLNGKHANKYTMSTSMGDITKGPSNANEKRRTGDEFVRRPLSEKVYDTLGIFQDSEVALEWRRLARPNWSFQVYGRLVHRASPTAALALLESEDIHQQSKSTSRNGSLPSDSEVADSSLLPTTSVTGGLRLRYDASGSLFTQSPPPWFINSFFLNERVTVDRGMLCGDPSPDVEGLPPTVDTLLPSWMRATRSASFSLDPVQSRLFGHATLELKKVTILPSIGSVPSSSCSFAAWYSRVRSALSADVTLRGRCALSQGGDRGSIFLAESDPNPIHTHKRFLRGVEGPTDTVRGMGVQSTPAGATTTPSRCYYTSNTTGTNWFVTTSAEVSRTLPFLPSVKTLLFWNTHIGSSESPNFSTLASHSHLKISPSLRRWKTVDELPATPPAPTGGAIGELLSSSPTATPLSVSPSSTPASSSSLGGLVHTLRSQHGVDVDASVGYAIHLKDGIKWGRFNDILPTRMECQWSWLSHAVAAVSSKTHAWHRDSSSFSQSKEAVATPSPSLLGSSTSAPSPFSLPPGMNFSKYVKCGIVWSSEAIPS